MISTRRAKITFGAVLWGGPDTVSVSPGLTESRVHPRARRRVGVGWNTADHFWTVAARVLDVELDVRMREREREAVTIPVTGPRVWSMKYSTPPP